MKWFEGSITDAVAESQAKKSLFCVVILGEDEASQELGASLESKDVQTIIRTENIVCIRIAAESQELQHFARIYPNAKSPSVYCISNQGVPVEIIPNALDSSALKERFNAAVTKHKEIISVKVNAPAAPAPVQVQIQSVSVAHSSAAEGATTSTPAPTPAGSSTSISSGTDREPLESRIERAKLLAAAKQQKRAEEEAEEEKKREVERRQVGQKVAELKRWQEEQEMKKLAEERRKDKEQEVQLRKRLRDQIAQDRIDRQARFDMASGVAPSLAESAPKKTSSADSVTKDKSNFTGQARLQFRLPDGSSQNHSFDPDSTLGQVRQYLIDRVVPFRDFTIWVAFPRREFTSTDFGTSLRDLGLLPSTALLIIPVTSTSIVQNAGNAGQGLVKLLSTLVGYLLAPITFILSFFQRALPTPQTQNNSNPGPSGSTNPRNRPPNRSTLLDQNSSSSSNSKKSDPGPSNSGESRGKSSQGKKTTDKGMTEGNVVHRLRTSESDSDDEQATWNGNSTQQM